MTAPASANWLAAIVILALLVLAAIVSAARKDVTQGFDELAHASYVAQFQHDGGAPDLERMRLLDPRTFRFTGEPNYLNHPAEFYALLALLGPKLEGEPRALFAHRLLNVALVGIGFAALLGLGPAARFSRHEYYAYAVPLACIPVLAPLAGAINNDNLAFLGGALATLGLWQCVASGRREWLALALFGVVAASWAKLTGLLLTGTMVGGVVAYLLWRRRLPWRWTFALVIALLIAAAPYGDFVLRYGSPTPETPAQLALIADGARAAGWADLPRKSFPAYAAYFVVAFIAEWMPALGGRSALNNAMLALPLAALLCAGAGLALSVQRLARQRETALDVVVVAGAAALAATFAVHLGYSFGRHVATGWLMDAYPRYYLPLAAIVPLAGLSLLGAVTSARWRTALLGVLIAGPIVFRMFGAPLG